MRIVFYLFSSPRSFIDSSKSKINTVRWSKLNHRNEASILGRKPPITVSRREMEEIFEKWVLVSFIVYMHSFRLLKWIDGSNFAKTWTRVRGLFISLDVSSQWRLLSLLEENHLAQVLIPQHPTIVVFSTSSWKSESYLLPSTIPRPTCTKKKKPDSLRISWKKKTTMHRWFRRARLKSGKVSSISRIPLSKFGRAVYDLDELD